MKNILSIGLIAVVMTAGSAFAQMGGGQHMMGDTRELQPQAQQGTQPYYGMMGYGMYPGMMTGYGMQPGMMGGYGMQQPMMGYGMPHMYPGMMGYGTAPCMSGYGMQQPMMGYGMPNMYPGAGGSVEKQRGFLKETSKLRKKIHNLMFDYMEARWNPETKPGQFEKLGKEMQGLQQELYEKSKELLK